MSRGFWSRAPGAPVSVGDGLQDEGLQQLAVVRTDGAGRLGHGDDHQLFLGIDPERGAVSAAPVVVALGAGERRDARLATDGEAESESVARARPGVAGGAERA